MGFIMLLDLFRAISDATSGRQAPTILFIYPMVMCVTMVIHI